MPAAPTSSGWCAGSSRSAGCRSRSCRTRSRCDVEPVRDLDLTGFGAVVVTVGFRPDYASWVDVPGAFDALGFPIHEACGSTAVPGLWFAGVHFLRKRKSSLLVGVGEDAAIVADGIAAEV